MAKSKIIYKCGICGAEYNNNASSELCCQPNEQDQLNIEIKALSVKGIYITNSYISYEAEIEVYIKDVNKNITVEIECTDQDTYSISEDAIKKMKDNKISNEDIYSIEDEFDSYWTVETKHIVDAFKSGKTRITFEDDYKQEKCVGIITPV